MSKPIDMPQPVSWDIVHSDIRKILNDYMLRIIQESGVPKELICNHKQQKENPSDSNDETDPRVQV